MILRARLLFLSGFSLIALSIAVLSAWRTAQISEIFAERQAETVGSSAVREMQREAAANPNGRTDSDINSTRRKLLPHERDIYQNLKEPVFRSAAIALHRFAETAGGFCSAGGALQGLIAEDNFGASPSAAELDAASEICRQAQSSDNLTARQIIVDNRTMFIAAAPVLFDNNSESAPDLLKGAVVFRRLPAQTDMGDLFNLLTQGFLLILAISLALLSFLTARDWQSGMTQIEAGLRLISHDLKAKINSPAMPELVRISASINSLATNLDENLGRQKVLEQSLMRNEKLAALGRVAAGIAHEVRNPLASIKLEIQLAERGKFEPEKIKITFRVLQEEVDRLDTLVKKLLDLSHPAKLGLTRFSMAELIEQRLFLISEQAAAQSVRIKFEKQSETMLVFADRDRLGQVFDNLFHNSLEAMPTSGALEIVLENHSGFCRVRISDTGHGLSEIEHEQLFEPFFTTKDSGTGLGLTISREIIEAHRGTIYLFDNQAAGASFIIELPTANLPDASLDA